MQDVVLTLNAGSSSLKFALHPIAAPDTPVLRGKITGLKRAAEFSLSVPAQESPSAPALSASATHEEAMLALLDWLSTLENQFNITAAGHRVVHGGREFSGPARFDADVLARLTALTPLAPLHQPHNLAPVVKISESQPELPQVACFDTAFHTTMHPLAKTFALPAELREAGLQRYGFHGLSYEYIASQLPNFVPTPGTARVVVAHLGNGASACAMRGGQSVATTMGFTALDGLVMGRRSGRIDPGVILHLVQQRGMSVPEIEKLLYQQSGLLGVSGISNAMQDLEASDAPDAKLAVDLFCYRAASEIAGMIPALGGLDALVFTAGIGENSAHVRAEIARHLAWMGAEIDPAKNEAGQIRISADTSKLELLVIPTNEDAVIAQSTIKVAGL